MIAGDLGSIYFQQWLDSKVKMGALTKISKVSTLDKDWHWLQTATFDN